MQVYNISNLPPMRLDFDAAGERLVIKLVSGAHDYGHREFSAMFTNHIRTLAITRHHLKSFGSRRDTGSNNRKKEPDESFKPDTRTGENDRATFVIGIGLIETLNQLRSDAHYWLTKTNGEVKIVLLILIKRAARIIQLERWESRPNPRLTRSNSNSQRPTKIQMIQIQVPGAGPTTVIGGPLDLPINLIFDVIPPGVPTTGITLPNAELRDYAEEYFRVSQ
jgi:hypothetical protein